MTQEPTDSRPPQPAPRGVERRIRDLSSDPGRPALQALTQFVSVVNVRLFGIARDRERPEPERLGAIAQLGMEAEAAGDADPKGVRPQIRELLDALRHREEACPNDSSRSLLEALEIALGKC